MGAAATAAKQQMRVRSAATVAGGAGSKRKQSQIELLRAKLAKLEEKS
jgi:hypothetical protein